MKQSMKKAALVLMLALAVLLVPQWSNTALAVTTPSDITTAVTCRPHRRCLRRPRKAKSLFPAQRRFEAARS